MSGILIKEDPEKEARGETFEKGILRKVIREGWKTNTTTTPTAGDQKITQTLDEHAARMEKLLGSFDYGALCMPNIMMNAKRMSHRELVAYVAYLESLGTGYKEKFNGEFASIFLAGLTLKARDLRSISRHLEIFTQGMEKKLAYYVSKSEKQNKSLDELLIELETKDSGLLKFFRKGEIRQLKRMITLKSQRVNAIAKRRDRVSFLIAKVKGPKK